MAQVRLISVADVGNSIRATKKARSCIVTLSSELIFLTRNMDGMFGQCDMIEACSELGGG